MTLQHKQLAAGGWDKFNFLEQMANIGSEVERAISWRKKKNFEYSQAAFFRALELLDLTIASYKSYPKLKELARLREAIVDYFVGDNQYSSADELWHKYFYPFSYAARM